MSAPSRSEIPIDATIASVQAKVRRLEAQRAELRARLLCLQAQRPHAATNPESSENSANDSLASPSPPLPPETPKDDDILRSVLSSSAILRDHTATRLHRIAGITTFPVRDAIQAASEVMLGVRIDIFSSHSKTFTPSAYIILRALEDGWRVERHSLPAFVGVAAVAAKYLPTGKVAGTQSVEQFVRCVRKAVAKWRLRETGALMTRNRLMADTGVYEDGTKKRKVLSVTWDREVASVEIKLQGGITAVVRIGDTGKVEAAVVKDSKRLRGHRIESEMKRGSLQTLAEHLWEGLKDLDSV